MKDIPDTMKAILLEAYNANLVRALRSLKLVEMPVPKPAAGQVLVKMEAAPVNPSDIAFVRGGYNIQKELPAVPGFEGTGTVVMSGENTDPDLKGARVCFFSQNDRGGTWAEYVIVNANLCMPVSEELAVEQAACLFVNPLTAYGMMDHVLENQHEALIQSAAMGQVGEFVRFFAGDHQVKVINLVRKESHVKTLHDQGEKYVLDTSYEDFPDALHRLAADLNATAAIDAVGGDLTGRIFNAMPTGSEVILFGGLSGMPVSQMDPLELIFKNKILSGFNLGDWLQEKPPGQFGKISKYLQLLFLEKKLETRIQANLPLADFYDGIRKYISAMSDGKVLFRM